jgi:hypothetical protein
MFRMLRSEVVYAIEDVAETCTALSFHVVSYVPGFNG